MFSQSSTTPTICLIVILLLAMPVFAGGDGPPAITECSGNDILLDGGFDGGSPNANWVEFSSVGGDVIQPLAAVNNDVFTVIPPIAGNVAFLGGYTNQAATESISQTIQFPRGFEVRLGMLIQYRTGQSGLRNGDGTLTLSVDGDELWTMTATNLTNNVNFRSTDLSNYADGLEHTITITGSHPQDADSTFGWILDDLCLTANFASFCPGNLILDPGFESGGQTNSWNEPENGKLFIFGSAGQRSGTWTLRVQGVSDEVLSGSASQLVSVPVDSTVLLSFWLRVNIIASNPGPADLIVRLGGQQIYSMESDDPSFTEGEFKKIAVDVSDLGSDTPQLLEFVGVSQGPVQEPISINIDDVCMVADFACDDGILLNAGFEDPDLSPGWSEVAQFNGSLKADLFPFSGTSHVRFGGPLAINDWVESITQTVIVPPTGSATLNCYVASIPLDGFSPDNDDRLRVLLDGFVVASLAGTDADYIGNYALYSVDLPSIADGEFHDITIEATTNAHEFYLDNLCFTVGEGFNCPENILADGSFEDGFINFNWLSDASNGPSVLSDDGNLGLARTGGFFSYFGGVPDDAYDGFIEQEVLLPPEGMASLNFYLNIASNSFNSEDKFEVLVNDEVVFTALESNTKFQGEYAGESIDLSSYTGGPPITLRFQVTTTGNDGVSTFWLDDICLTVVDAFACDGLLEDPSLEFGSNNAYWVGSSTAGIDVITDGGIPRSGFWCAQFGNATADSDTSALTQTVTIPLDSTASLEFYAWNRIPSGNGIDRLEVRVDDILQVSIIEADASYQAGYLAVNVDLTGFADGEPHVIEVRSVGTAGPNNTLWYADDFCISVTGGFDCGDGVLADNSFEAGNGGSDWSQSSTPAADLLLDNGIPRSGSWHAQFGGISNEAVSQTLSQSITLPDGFEAELSFYLRIQQGSGSGEDLFSVTVDGGDNLFVATDADTPTFSDYLEVVVDLTEFADGQVHTLELNTDQTASAFSTNFFVDDLCLTFSFDEDALHSADTTLNNSINLSELLRVIQFFNSDGFHCDGLGEDGYNPGPGLLDCEPHDSDYNTQDWEISLSELLRLIQLYNIGAYMACPQGEDFFCPFELK